MAYFKAGSLYFAQNSNVVVDNASGDIANFETPLCLPLLETKLGFSAKQDLHGYDSPWMDSTVLDKKPYLLQPISGTASRYGNYLYDKLIGGTVAFNQLVTMKTSWAGITISTDANGVSTLSGTSVNGYVNISDTISLIEGHKYIIGKTVIANPNNINFYWSFLNSSTNPVSSTLKSTDTKWYILNVTSHSGNSTGIAGYAPETDLTGLKIQIICIDLTQMFGSTIADYIYSLEQATAGAGVAFFRKLFPKPYYAYNAGELMSVKTSKHITTGLNIWNEEWKAGTYDIETGLYVYGSNRVCSKDLISVLPSTQYYFKAPSGENIGIWVLEYDANGEYTGIYRYTKDTVLTTKAQTHYIAFYLVGGYTTYKNDICISVSSSKNGTYEPYSKHEYALDSDLELRGIPKLDANNNLYYDGDIYESSGKVTRKYGIVDLGTLSWFSGFGGFASHSLVDIIKIPESGSVLPNIAIPNRYTIIPYSQTSSNDKAISVIYGGATYAYNGYLVIKDSSYNDGAVLKASLSGVYLIYELATPTTETADAFTNPQVSDQYGTEEYVDSRTIPIPVGHETYQANICPIDGVSEVGYTHCKKNIFPVKAMSHDGIDITLRSDGGILINGRCNTDFNATVIANAPAGNYTLSCRFTGTLPSIGTPRCQIYHQNTGYAKQIGNQDPNNKAATVELDSDLTGVEFRIRFNSNFDYDNVIYYPQLEPGSTLTEFEPYHDFTHALIQLGDTYYGGEVIIDKDGKRKVKATHKEFDLSTLNWSLSTVGPSKWYSLMSDSLVKNSNTLCPIYASGNDNEWTTLNNIINVNTNVNGSFIRISDTRFENLTREEIQASLSGIKAYCVLETPLLIDLPDGAVIKSIPAVNNIFCDTGDTTVKFRKIGD